MVCTAALYITIPSLLRVLICWGDMCTAYVLMHNVSSLCVHTSVSLLLPQILYFPKPLQFLLPSSPTPCTSPPLLPLPPPSSPFLPSSLHLHSPSVTPSPFPLPSIRVGDRDQDGSLDWLQKWLQDPLPVVHGDHLVGVQAVVRQGTSLPWIQGMVY